MNENTIAYSGLLLVSVFIASISQVMLKKASLHRYESLVEEYLNPLVIGAYTLFLCTTMVSVLAYRMIPLSMGPVLESTSYIYVTFFGVVIFKEKLNKQKLMALFFILGGILVYSIWGNEI